jgi:hypothetical protein
MPLNDVRINVKDGGLGISNVKGEGVHVKIGASPKTPNKLVTITNGMDAKKIKEKLGISPLADSVMDSISLGSSLVYCIPVNPSVEGSISDVTKEGSGEGTYATSGKPNNEYEIVIKIIEGGELNKATYKYSLDGGDNYTQTATVAVDGIINLEGTGVKITFTQSSNPKNTFKDGDTFKFKTKAPTMSNKDVLDAVNILKNLTLEFEYIHIVGESTKTLWAALAVEAENLFSIFHKPIFFLCEARNKASDEDLDTYVQSLLEERKAVSSYKIQVIPARVEFTAMDGKIRDTNGAGLICGLYSRARVSQSIGEVREFPLSGVMKLLPEGIEDYIQTLDENNYVTFRQYIGLNGFYVTNARMFAPDGSDYQYAELVRTMNKAVKETRKEALTNIHSQIDPTDQEGSIKAFTEFIQVPIERMVKDKDLISARVIVPEGQDIIGTSKLEMKIRAVPRAIMREIEIEFGMENPFI